MILACRSSERTLPVVEEIKKETGNDQVEFMELDLGSLASVTKFSEEYHSKGLPLHVLLNNAGIMYGPFRTTAEGIEAQFGTNHVGHFLLTQLLFDVLDRSQPSRVVQVSSMAHMWPYNGGVVFDKINDQAHYKETLAYGQSKLCNILFARELAKRVEGKKIYVNAIHPGYVHTDLQRNIYDSWNPVYAFLARLGHRLFALSPVQGAMTQLYVATHPDIEAKGIVGRYFVPIAKESTTSALGNDGELGKKLWAYTEELLKEKLGDAYKPQI